MKYKLIYFLLLLLFLGGCASKKPAGASFGGQEEIVLNDIRDFPQNLEIFAKQAGQNRILLAASTQNALTEKFLSIFFGPWQMTRTSIKKGEITPLFRRARGYRMKSVPWTQAEWDFMRGNANLDSYPSRALHAITLRNTDLRELPTHEPRFSEPTENVRENPFDYFQYSLLPIGTPLLVAHTTLDRRWHYVETPVAGGWVDSRDVAFVDDEFKNLWKSGRYAALIRDNVLLPGTGMGGSDTTGGIGVVLPLLAAANSSLNVLLPVKNGRGFAEAAEIALPSASAALLPLPLTPGNVAKIGNVMMGQPYGWGGYLGERDCSAMIRDLFTPFGIWLPRNSVAQARRGAVTVLAGSAGQKEKVILENGVPFLSLVGMKGHITLYVGEWHGKPAIFHNAWGLRIIKNGDDDERYVIGRAVVTSIMPGMELENLYRPVTFADRLRSLTKLGSR